MPAGAVDWSGLASPDFRRSPVQPAADGEQAVGLLPVGATEQHGPHLPTGTDTIIATELCRRASARTGAPVLPAAAIGASYGHGTRLPGTLSLSPRQLADHLTACARWAAHSGVKRLLIVNAHAGNQGAIGLATDELRFERPDLRVGALHWWQSDPSITRELLDDGDDVHANRGETAVMLAIAPELVRTDAMANADDPDRTAPLVFAYTAERLSTNGVTGRPSEATAALGHQLVGRAVDALTTAVLRGRSERAPLESAERVAPAGREPQ